MLPDFSKFHQRDFPKAKIWRAAEEFVFGQYLPRLDGVKLWHFADESHWMQAHTFDDLIQAVKERGWYDVT